MTSGEKQETCGETFFKISPFLTGGGEEVRVSILREWTLAIQGEGATSTFSDLREWEERGMTTPIIEPTFQKEGSEIKLEAWENMIEVRENRLPYVSV